MSPSQIFFGACLSFLGGIALSSLVEINQILMLVVLILGIFLVSMFWRYKRALGIGICIMAASLGMGRYLEATHLLFGNELGVYNDLKEKVALVGRVAEEPQRKTDRIQLVITPFAVSSEKFDTVSISQGKVLVHTELASLYQYGDILRMNGYLKDPDVFDDFDYRMFLAKEGIYSVMHNPEIELVERGRHDTIKEKFYGMLLEGKQKLREVLSRHLSPPQSALLAALLLGDQDRLSDDLKEKLNRTGVRHITAISGQHVALLIPIVMSFLIWIGLWRQQAFYLTLCFIVTFIVLVGAQPSAVRAGIMGTMLLVGEHMGRINVSFRALVFAAALMLWLNPLLLKYDAGFQLSFLAVLGIILFLPLFQIWFRKIPETWGIRDILGMTVAAQIMTFPVLVSSFGYVSVVFIITNLLILPIMAILLILGFLFLLAGLLWQFLGAILSIPVFLLLTYTLWIVELFAKLPFASLRVENAHIAWFLLYIPLFLFCWKFRKRKDLPSSYL
ncbi:MAG: ComEC/Rec2 family competence protein [Patescibacteria group bacterium]